VIRVLTVDDQPLIRDALRTIVDREPDLEMVGDVGSGEEAVGAVRRHRPDVVLMDVRMPGTDGIAATRTVLAEPDPPKVLILTTFDLDEYVHAGLRAGASGFLLKDTEAPGIVAAIRAAYRGDATLSPAVTRRLISAYVEAPAPDATVPTALTDRETDVLRAIARGLSNAEVARELYVSETTVKTHVTAILTKLGVRDRLQAVIAAYETGLVRPGA
jgi:DNA-binding NarL/FixJ family response regulator